MSGVGGDGPDLLVRRHLRLGWWALLGFLGLGLVIEALHGFKVGWYLDVSNETRRHLWTLAHAHGSLLGLLNILFALSVRALPSSAPSLERIASPCLAAATLALPGGFLLGGAVIYGGDPGVGVLLTPIGGMLLAAAVWSVARRA